MIPSSIESISNNNRLSLWLMRCLLALLLMLAVEVLFWNDPASRPLREWPIMLVGYLTLATIALDLLVRYRVRDLWGVVAVVGIISALNALFLNPQHALESVPQTLINRMLGGYWFISLEMLGLFLVMLGGNTWAHKRPLLMGAMAVGFFWATWVKWYPAFFTGAYRAVSVYEMFDYLILLAVPLLVLWLIIRRRPAIEVQHFAITWHGYAAAGLLAMLLLIYHASQNHYENETGLILSLIIIGILWAMIWYREDTQKPPLLATYLQGQSVSILWMLLCLVVFVGMALLGFFIDLVTLFDLNQFTLLHLVFSLVGASWIPLTAAVLGVRGTTRHMRLRGY